MAFIGQLMALLACFVYFSANRCMAVQADGALGEHLTTMWIHFTGWDGFSQENT